MIGKINTLNDKEVVLDGVTVPVVWNGDVIVAGGGCGGIGAAIAANRNGCKTIVLEALGFLGGMASYGAGMPLGGAYPGLKTIGGIAEEILTIVRNAGKDAADVRHVKLFGDWYYHDSEFFRSMIADFFIKEKIEVRLHSFVTDVIMKDDRNVAGIITVSKSGMQAYLAKTVIDATGDADICARAGARFDIGDEAGDLMAMTIPFNMGGCDVVAFEEYRKKDKELVELVKKAQDMGIPVSNEDRFRALGPGVRPGWIFNNAIRVRNYDGTNVEDLTKAEMQARSRVLVHLQMFRAVVPGCENAYIANTAPTIGIRDTRRIVGEDYLSTQDCLDLRKRPDTVILRCAGPFDNTTRGSHDNPHNQIDITQHYDIPYGCMVPKDLDNVIIAGRTFSSSALAQSGSRGQALLMGMGEAAGLAAKIACAMDKPVFKDVNIKQLQKDLIAAGCDLGI